MCELTAAAIVDWNQLLGLRELQPVGGNDVIEELVGCFLVDSASRMASIGTAAVHGDSSTIAFEAHTLKGSAGLLGAEQFRRAAERLEHEAKSGHQQDLGPLVEHLALCLTAVRHELHRGLESSPAMSLAAQPGGDVWPA